MDISNAATATAFLAAWNGKPRRGILNAAIDGLRTALGIAQSSTRYSTETVAGYVAAIAVLEAAR